MRSRFGRIVSRIAIFCGALLICFNLDRNAYAGNDILIDSNYTSILDIDKKITFLNKTEESYVSGSLEWRFSSGGALTLAQKYCFDRLTGVPVIPSNDQKNESKYGDIIFDNKNKITDHTMYAMNTDIEEGYHIYAYTPPDGTQIPLIRWIEKPQVHAIHGEGVRTPLIDPAKYGRWATYKGVEYHSTAEVPMTAPNEVRTVCVNEETGLFNENHECWHAVCAFCGELVNGMNIYAPYSAVLSLPVLKQGQEIVLTCPSCGGMEQGAPVIHTCKAISANRYFVNYEAGTKDPAVCGATAQSIWYYNFSTTYESKEVEYQDRKVSECGFERPGYTFAGWSTTEGGEVEFNPGANIIALQSKLDLGENNSVVTLYAVWEPNYSHLVIDANAGAFNGGALYNGKAVWTSDASTYQILSSADNGDHGLASGFSKNYYTIDISKITLPKGYSATFVSEGSQVVSIEAVVEYSSYEVVTENPNGSFSGSRCYFGPEERDEASSDRIILQYAIGAITLPSSSKANECFVGWYTDPTFREGTYAGTSGDYYVLKGDETLYARFSTIELSVTDVYYKAEDTSDENNYYGNVMKDENGKVVNSASYATSNPSDSLAVWNATGAANLSMSMFTPNSFLTIYRPYYKLAASSEWVPFGTSDGEKADEIVNNFDAEYSDHTSLQRYVVQSTGIYKLSAYGAWGEDTNPSKLGTAGGYLYGNFYLKEGEELEIEIGKPGYSYDSEGEYYGYTRIYKIEGGKRVLLLSATGGDYYEGCKGTAVKKTSQETCCPNGARWNSSSTWLDQPQTCPSCGTTTHYRKTSVFAPHNCSLGTVWTYGYYCHACGYKTGNNPSWVVTDSSNGWNCYNKYTAVSYPCNECGINQAAAGPCQSVSATPTSGDNYINPAEVLAGSYVFDTSSGYVGEKYVDSENDKYGKASVTGVKLGLVDGENNYAELLNVHMPDKTAPSAVGEITSDLSEGVQKLHWEPAVSNGTSYNFKAELCTIGSNGEIEVVLVSDAITRVMESEIAGYYYVYSNEETLDVATHVNAHYSGAYTWKNHHYSDDVTGFTPSPSVTLSDNDYLYVHIAAVDVAGNIGPSVSKEIVKTNLSKITFDTNKLKYQINPEETVSVGSWTPDSEKMTTSANGENKEGHFYQGYYAVDGTDIENDSKGTFDGITGGLSYGGDFPIPSATGCVFVGWNTKPDGKGLYVSAKGDNIGYNEIEDEVLIISNLTESHDYGQELTLYAIWADVAEGTSIDNTKSSDISKEQEVVSLNSTSGVGISNGQSVVESEVLVTSDKDDVTWVSSATVTTKARFKATGVYKLSQHILSASGVPLQSTVYYMSGLESEYAGNAGVEKFEDAVLSATGSSSLDIPHDDSEKSMSITYNLQGSFKVYGSAVSRTYASNLPGILGEQGYPANTVTESLNLKLDNTAPVMSYVKIDQDTLDNYKADEIESAIENGLFTTFFVRASDYHDAANGAYVSNSDSAGLQGVYVIIGDVKDLDNASVYKLTETRLKSTDFDSHTLEGEYSLSINLYREFPNADILMYRLFAVDNAGNISEVMDSFSIVDTNGNESQEYPTGSTELSFDTPTECRGRLFNFSIKTVAYNDEHEAFNVAEGESYFQIGDIGHVEVWTVGYVERIAFNFGEMGAESAKEIKDGQLLPKYNLGVLDIGYERELSYDVGEILSSIPANESGVPYAVHYNVSGWQGEGTSIRIPPYYALTQDGVDEDGEPTYEWELWEYEVLAHKNTAKISGISTYVLWDTKSNDVHYRVIH